MKNLIPIAFALTLSACAGVPEGRCIPWGEDSCEAPEPRWTYETTYEKGRDPSSGTSHDYRRASQLAERQCNVATTPWRPEKPVSVRITDQKSSTETKHDCSDYRD